MAGEGFQVDPAELNTFADYVNNTTVPAVRQAASTVAGLNGGDVNAFGILLAQIMAIPARIAMRAVSDNLGKIADNVADTATTTKKAADAYTKQDGDAQAGLNEFKTELGQ